MKILITGATGFIGAEVLQQCLANPLITSVVTISRRPLSKDVEANPKLRNVILPDLNKWEGDVVKELEGADGMIW